MPFSSRIIAEALKPWKRSAFTDSTKGDWFLDDYTYTAHGYLLNGDTAELRRHQTRRSSGEDSSRNTLRSRAPSRFPRFARALLDHALRLGRGLTTATAQYACTLETTDGIFKQVPQQASDREEGFCKLLRHVHNYWVAHSSRARCPSISLALHGVGQLKVPI